MIQLVRKFSVLLVVIAFSTVWIGDQFSVFSNENKYDLYEYSENNSEENKLESKSKTLFLVSIENINCYEYYTFDSNEVISFHLFPIKELVLKNLTPPPETV